MRPGRTSLGALVERGAEHGQEGASTRDWGLQAETWLRALTQSLTA